MEKRIGNLLIDRSPPERAKFRSPLILVHGLWSGSWSWQAWATHLSNLGWDCWALNFHGRFGDMPRKIQKSLSFENFVDDLRTVLRACPDPPVVAAHDFGSLIALKAAETEQFSALVLISPLLPRNFKKTPSKPVQRLRLKYFPVTLLRRPFRLEDKDLRRYWLATLPEAERQRILKRLVPEASHLMREFLNDSVEVDPKRLRCPLLIVAGSEDPLVSVESLRELAELHGWEFRSCPSLGHWLLAEQKNEGIARDVHRWIVRRLGEAILLAEFPD